MIPQAAMAGKLKRNRPQYHAQAKKDVCRELYAKICDEFERQLIAVNEDVADESARGRFIHGTFDAPQTLLLESDGPNTHFFEF